jgi:hypothetical protein
MEDLALVQARWRLGVLPPESLPEIARRALADGEEGPALRALAALRDPARSEVGSLFEDALDETGHRAMGLEEAGTLVAGDLAAKVLAGELSPVEGARRIAWDVWDRCRTLEHLGIFVTLMERWDGERDHCEVIEEAIRREARKLLE